MHVFNRFKSQNDRVRRLIRSRDVGKQKKIEIRILSCIICFSKMKENLVLQLEC